MPVTNEADQPWYRQFWFWFLMTPLLVVMLVVLTFVGISLFYADDLVVDSYYKEGRTINQSFEQEARAHELELKADLQFDQVTGEVLLNLESNQDLPPELLLAIDHPVSADFDERIRLREISPGYYRGDLTRPLEYRWYLTLLPELDPAERRQADWLLRGEIDFAIGDSTQLKAPTPGADQDQ